MKSMYQLFILGIAFLQISCKPEPITPTLTPTPIETFPKLIWVQKTPAEVLGAAFTKPIIHNGLVIVDQECSGAPTKEQFVWGYDKITGEKRWEQSNFEGDGFYDHHRFGNKAVYTTGPYNACINLDNGEIIWKNLQNGNPRIDGYGDKVFKTVDYGKSIKSDSTSILLFDLNTGKQQKILTHIRIGKYYPGLETVTLWIDQNKDSILFYQNRGGIDTIGYPGRVDLHAYNLSKKQALWAVENIEDNSSVNARPTVVNNQLYFSGMRNIYCLNPNTGKLNWKWYSKEHNGSLVDDWLIAENKIFIKPGSTFIYALDATTGKEVWAKSRKILGEAYNNFVFYKGALYATSWSDTRLLAIDPNTGNELWNFGKGVFGNAYKFTIDPDTGYFYMHDGIKLYCYQLAAK